MQPMIYAHEHVTIDLSAVKGDLDCKLDNKAQTIEAFKALKDRGVVGIVDMTNRGMGRDIQYVEEVKAACGLEILCATGYYKEPFLPEEVYVLEERALANLMLRELEVGIGNSGIKAQVIGEIGTSKNRIMPLEQKVLTAGSLAHLETGAPIITHTTLGTMAIEQIELFRYYGVNLAKVVISHNDLADDLDYMRRVLDTGVTIGFDTIGKKNYQRDETRVKTLKILCDEGYSTQMVLSMDITRRSYMKQNGGIGYNYLIDHFVPMLKDEGVDQRTLNQLLYTNAKRIYPFKEAL